METKNARISIYIKERKSHYMLRYVKANSKWYDTLIELINGNIYHEVDGKLYLYAEEDICLGKIEEQSNTL